MRTLQIIPCKDTYIIRIGYFGRDGIDYMEDFEVDQVDLSQICKELVGHA